MADGEQLGEDEQGAGVRRGADEHGQGGAGQAAGGFVNRGDAGQQACVRGSRSLRKTRGEQLTQTRELGGDGRHGGGFITGRRRERAQRGERRITPTRTP